MRKNLLERSGDWLLAAVTGLFAATYISLVATGVEAGDFRFLWFKAGATDTMLLHAWLMLLLINGCLGILASRFATVISAMLALSVPAGWALAQLIWYRLVLEKTLSLRESIQVSSHPSWYLGIIFCAGAWLIGRQFGIFARNLRREDLVIPTAPTEAASDGHEEQMAELPSGAWPVWNWRDSGWWFTILGCVFSIIANFNAPNVALGRRVWIVLGSFAVTMLILVIIHCAKMAAVALFRCTYYQQLFTHTGRQQTSLSRYAELLNNLIEQLEANRRFQIKSVRCYRNDMYVTVRKKRGAPLNLGRKLEVIDLQDSYLLGRFEIVENRDEGYCAKGIDSVSPVWRGYVANLGDGEIPAPPNAVAVLIKEGEQDDAATA